MFHRGPYVQRGRGFGSLFSSLFRYAVPALKTLGGKIMNSSITRNVGKTLANSAMQGGLSLAADGLAGKNVGESFSKNIEKARQDVASTLRKEAVSRRPPAKRKRMPPPRKPVLKQAKKQGQPRKSLFEDEDEIAADSD